MNKEDINIGNEIMVHLPDNYLREVSQYNFVCKL